VADLDRLIRLEEFLRGEERVEATKFIFEWTDYDGGPEKVSDEEDASSDAKDEDDGAAQYGQLTHPIYY